MIDFLKKAVKPITTGAMVLLGIGAAYVFSDPKNWRDIFTTYVDPPVGPWRNPDFFKNAETDKDGVIILHADELQQLRWMTVSQLKAIFKGNRQKFRIESTPAAYEQLRWMSTSQIEAIFGTKDIR